MQVAANLKVPQLCFFSMCAFCVLCQHNVERYNSYNGVADDNEPVVVLGMERRIEVMRAQAPGFFRGAGFEKLADEIELALVESGEVVMNSFLEMDLEYVAGDAAARNMKPWTMGPVSLYHQHAETLGKSGNTTTAINADESLRVAELGLRLKVSGHPFVCVLENPDQYGEDVCEFMRDLKECVDRRGMLIKGWSPHVLILNHAVAGGFMMHRGWNSMLEAIAAGLPVVTWPHFSDHFLNEKLAVEVLRISGSVGIKELLLWVAKKGVVVGREVVEAVVRSIMDGGGEGEEEEGAGALGEGEATVQKGGLSLGNLLDLIKHFEAFTLCRGFVTADVQEKGLSRGAIATGLEPALGPGLHKASPSMSSWASDTVNRYEIQKKIIGQPNLSPIPFFLFVSERKEYDFDDVKGSSTWHRESVLPVLQPPFSPHGP
uniref:Cytokinin-O-glucosyltransferase 1 n=1 Tax=Aegilops tauschii TaxID=37682 RepID=M8BKR3_AEGTA